MMKREYLRSKEVAEKLGLAVGTIFRMARRGQFPSGVKFGRARRWNEDEINAWAAAQSEGA
ncbi:MAG: helix-turn-helix domain-containing protein [Ruminococcus sp.]|nr:helix-turn-helix domain-containing protein [Synergistaceae bacterium]MBR1731573.1 helix-turn-helix domain-containing protein [Ruminococcus sp.]